MSREYPRQSAVEQVLGYTDRHDAILFACCDPGAFTQRGDNYEESLESWQAHAVQVALEILDRDDEEDARIEAEVEMMSEASKLLQDKSPDGLNIGIDTAVETLAEAGFLFQDEESPELQFINYLDRNLENLMEAYSGPESQTDFRRGSNSAMGIVRARIREWKDGSSFYPVPPPSRASCPGGKSSGSHGQ